MAFTIMEALSCSVPVICSNVSGNSEIINKKNGYLVNFFNKNEYLSISRRVLKDIKNNKYKDKQKESFKTSLNKIYRPKCLAEFGKIIDKHILTK